MKNTKPIYTIGHRNPDTDSICSAIGYAHLKQAMGENVVPARAGKVNEETKFALNHFHVEQPLLITDLYPRVKDITLDCKTVVKETDSLRHLGEIMRENDLKSVPVVDKDERLIGIVTVSDLAQRYFKELSMQNLADAGVSFRDVIRVIDGEVIVNGDEGGKIRGNVRIAAGSISMIQDVVKEHDVVLIGDRRDETLIDCLKQGIDCMIVTGNGRVSPSVIEEAEERHMLIINTPYDTYTCARLINQCVPVKRIMQDEIVAFKPLDLLSDIKGTMEQYSYRNYPVVENGKLVGLVSKDMLMVPERERVILVDHNERGQAVEGIEEAKILEIIDHHRLGGERADLHASRACRLHGDDRGEHALAQGCRHPAVDRRSAPLGDSFRYGALQVADLHALRQEDGGTSGGDCRRRYHGIWHGNMSPLEITKNDMKEFQIGDYRIIVSQISVMDTKEVMDIEAEIVKSMADICKKEGYDMSLVMVTDIIAEGTYLLYTGSPKTLIGEAFHKDASGTHIYLPGVMSRKKQIIPPLSEAVKLIKKQ